MTREPTRGPAGWPTAWPLLLAGACAVISAAVLRGALEGPFISDDGGYIVANIYLQEPTPDHIAAWFDPTSPAQIYAVGNYSPVHTLLHALEWQIFAERTLGYHLVNVAVHALVCVLFAALLLRSGAPPAGALAAALIFCVHPANVQAVAWISQLKSTAGLAFAFGALLALPRRPAAATLLFCLGLLTKASAAFALPVAAAWLWVRGSRRGEWAWLGAWSGAFLAYAALEFSFFSASGWIEEPAYTDLGVHLRSIAAIGARYLVMAAAGFGTSAYQEPDPVSSWTDPWWLAALPLGALLAWRTVSRLRARDEEGVWWLLAAISWAPISQLFPFMHPIADHYLYFILPGLLGGCVLAAAKLAPRLPERAATGALAACAALAVFFAWKSSVRADLWTSNLRLEIEAAARFPNGRTAHLHRARAAANRGDVDAAVAELRGAFERGLYDFRLLEGDPGLAPIRDTPEMRELVREWAGRTVERSLERRVSSQSELRTLGLAHLKRGEVAAAKAAFERALATEGPYADLVRGDLERLRAREAADGGR